MPSQIESLVLLAAIIVAYSVAVSRIERLRLAVNDAVPNVANTWVIAGVLTLSAPMIILLVAVIYAAEWPARRSVEAKLYKHIYGGAALAAAGLIAELVIDVSPGPVGVCLAVLAFLATDTLLIAAVYIAARQHEVLRRMFSAVRPHLLEAGTAGAGVALAAGIGVSPAAALVALPALAGLHHSELRATIRAARAFDPVTGLWSEKAWPVRASMMLADISPSFLALLVVEPLDGASAGDVVRGLGRWVHAGDLLGRLGQHKVALLMQVGPASGADACLAGIRESLRSNGIDATIGRAVGSPGAALDDLLIIALSELVVDVAVRALDPI